MSAKYNLTFTEAVIKSALEGCHIQPYNSQHPIYRVVNGRLLRIYVEAKEIVLISELVEGMNTGAARVWGVATKRPHTTEFNVITSMEFAGTAFATLYTFEGHDLKPNTKYKAVFTEVIE